LVHSNARESLATPELTTATTMVWGRCCTKLIEHGS